MLEKWLLPSVVTAPPSTGMRRSRGTRVGELWAVPELPSDRPVRPRPVSVKVIPGARGGSGSKSGTPGVEGTRAVVDLGGGEAVRHSHPSPRDEHLARGQQRRRVPAARVVREPVGDQVPWPGHTPPRSRASRPPRAPPRRAPCRRTAASPCGRYARWSGSRWGTRCPWPGHTPPRSRGCRPTAAPPATSTLPEGSSVAVWPDERMAMEAVGDQVPVAGSYTSALASEAVRAGAPRDEHLAGGQQRRSVICTRAVMEPVGDQVPVAGLIHLRAREEPLFRSLPRPGPCRRATASPCDPRERGHGAGGAPGARGRVIHLRAREQAVHSRPPVTSTLPEGSSVAVCP